MWSFEVDKQITMLILEAFTKNPPLVTFGTILVFLNLKKRNGGPPPLLKDQTVTVFFLFCEGFPNLGQAMLGSALAWLRLS